MALPFLTHWWACLELTLEHQCWVQVAGLKYINNIRLGVIGLGVMGGLGTEAAWNQVSAP